jgi:hypothetical protein
MKMTIPMTIVIEVPDPPTPRRKPPSTPRKQAYWIRQSKLNKAQVREIRRHLRVSGWQPKTRTGILSLLARQYEVSPSVVGSIANGKSWPGVR